MNAVEFFFALSAVTVMTIAIYCWTRFVYRLDQQSDEPRRLQTDDRISTQPKDDDQFVGIGMKSGDLVSEPNVTL